MKNFSAILYSSSDQIPRIPIHSDLRAVRFVARMERKIADCENNETWDFNITLSPRSNRSGMYNSFVKGSNQSARKSNFGSQSRPFVMKNPQNSNNCRYGFESYSM